MYQMLKCRIWSVARVAREVLFYEQEAENLECKHVVLKKFCRRRACPRQLGSGVAPAKLGSW
jgi:hypothetical protein